jgi:hypothetical protein
VLPPVSRQGFDSSDVLLGSGEDEIERAYLAHLRTALIQPVAEPSLGAYSERDTVRSAGFQRPVADANER